MQRDGDLGATGFTNGSLYDSARPDYPKSAIEYFVSVFDLGSTSRAVDLGAGTGIFTRQVLPHVGAMIAVDPSASMREALRASNLDVEVLEGRDTDIPVPDDTVDVVFVAQAFHWFDEARALDEIHRVLVVDGGLGLIWNERDESREWVHALSHAMQWDIRQPYDVGRDFTEVIKRGPFKDVERVTMAHAQTLTRQGLYQRVLSTSYISAMGASERDALMIQVSDVVEELVEPIALPYITSVYSARADVNARTDSGRRP